MKSYESRTKNSARNATFSVLNFFVRLILSFVARTIFIWVLGVEYLGLNSLFANILNVLSLAEMGVGSAIVFSMYKPMAENNEEAVKQLLLLYKKFYMIIGGVVLAAGIVVTPFVQYLIKGTPKVNVNLHIVFLIFLLNSVASYFFAHRRSLLLTSQRNDIEMKISTLVIVSLNLFQIVLLLIFKNYYVYVSLMIVFAFIENFIIVFVTNKKFPEFIGKPKTQLNVSEKKIINKNILALIFHKIGGIIVFATDSIAISVLIGLSVLGLYSNYLLITANIAALLAIISNSFRGSVGNLISQTDKNFSYKIFNKFNFAYLWFVGFCSICLFVLFQSFIAVWLGVNYKLGFWTMTLIVVSFYLTQSRGGVWVFKDGAGLFWNDRWKPLIESVIKIGATIGFGVWLGLPGIILGTIISTIAAPLWFEPYVLYRDFFNKKPVNYFTKYLFYALVTIIAGTATWLACYFIPKNGFGFFAIKLLICFVVPNLILLLCYFNLPEFKDLKCSIKEYLNSRKKK